LSPSELGRLVIRRSLDTIAESARIPDVVKPQWCDLAHDDEIPRLLLSLPPPLNPRDGGDGGALIVHSLIRQWVSSDRALHRALVRRAQKATALVAALESGTYPSKSDLDAWISGEDCVQLGFAQLMCAANPDSLRLLPTVRQHLAAVQQLAQRIKASNPRDIERAALIRSLRRKHKGIGIVAFSQYADTVEGLFDLLAGDGSVAVLTGSGARVFGGRISRMEAIERFAPAACGRKSARPAEAVTLLLTTDILSEGVNLQDAGVVIHLDLPWTPARMEQRLGRVARMGSRHESVFSYVVRPPASSQVLIRSESILRKKMASAGVVVDGLQSILPGTFTDHQADNLPRAVEEIRSMLEHWANDAGLCVGGDVVASAVLAPASGFIALCRTNGDYRILASDSQLVTDDPTRVVEMMRWAGGEETDFHSSDLAGALASANRYLRAASAIGSMTTQGHPRQLLQRIALRRISRMANDARPHERSYMLAASARARASIVGRLSAGQEAQLAGLLAARISDRDWLDKVGALSCHEHENTNAGEIVAMILFLPASLSKRDSRNKTLPSLL
jgi:helicase-like protein